VRNVIEKIGRGTIDRYRSRYFGERIHWAVGELAAHQAAALDRLRPPIAPEEADDVTSLAQYWRDAIASLLPADSSAHIAASASATSSTAAPSSRHS
jgi:hypothetical protein